MEPLNVTINGRAITNAEAETLKMILDMATMDLQSLDPKRVLEGNEVAAHLENISRLLKLVTAP
jgi:hypothetical protein